MEQNFEIKEFQFIDGEEDEAFASITLNPTFRWCKFILTDDQPNVNKERIPLEEFDNLIKSGVNAPIKMAAKEIKPGHAESFPLGVITALTKENNYIKGLAALWSRERPEDVQMIKELYDKGTPLNLSWEVLYASKDEEPDGVIALRDTALRATTFVGMPAYAGRTPILAVASAENDMEENKLDELETLKAKVAELELALSAKDTEIEQLKSENQSLASFKEEVELAKEKESKFAAIKAKFVDSGLVRSDEYFDTNKERLLALDDGSLDFMIQDLISFSAELATASEKKSDALPIINKTSTSVDPKELGRRLRNSK
jgi:hypothetical protein